MRTYLAFEPVESGRGAAAADRVLFLREKFSWPALFFTPFWLLWHRLWMGFFGWLTAVIAIAVIASLAGFHPQIAALAALFPSLAVAFEASELRRRKILRRGYRDAGTVIGYDMEDAERRFFTRWAASATRDSTVPATVKSVPPGSFAPQPSNQVLGLFPEPGTER